VLATARLATGLEARLRAALAGREAAETRAAAAARAAADVRGPAPRRRRRAGSGRGGGAGGRAYHPRRQGGPSCSGLFCWRAHAAGRGGRAPAGAGPGGRAPRTGRHPTLTQARARRQAEARVEREVSRRLELSGADARQWPRAAREEAARLDKRLAAASGLAAALRSEVAAEQAARQAEAVARAQLQARRRVGAPGGHAQPVVFAAGGGAGALQGGRAGAAGAIALRARSKRPLRAAAGVRCQAGDWGPPAAQVGSYACGLPHGAPRQPPG